MFVTPKCTLYVCNTFTLDDLLLMAVVGVFKIRTLDDLLDLKLLMAYYRANLSLRFVTLGTRDDLLQSSVSVRPRTLDDVLPSEFVFKIRNT